MDIISKNQFNKIDMSNEEEINQLRKHIQMQYFIYPKSNLWRKLFESIYNRYKYCLAEKELAEKIFRLSNEEFDKLKNGEFVEVFSEINNDNMNFTEKIMTTVEECLITHGLVSECISIELQIPIEKAEEYIKRVFALTGMTIEDYGRERVRRMYRENKTVEEIYYEVWLGKEEIDEVIQEEIVKLKEQRKEENSKLGDTEEKREEKPNLEEAEVQKGKEKAAKEQKKISEKTFKSSTTVKRKGTKAFKNLEEMTERVLDKYYYNPNNVAITERYIRELKKEYKIEDFPEEKIDFLAECIEFAQSGFESIEFFTKICISLRKYKKAIEVIGNNIDNKGISSKDKEKLKEMKSHLEYSIRKENVTNMILSGKTNVKELARLTGVLEVDVIYIRNSILSRKNVKKGKKLDSDEEVK